MIFKIITLGFIAAFYICYFAKMLEQRKRGISPIGTIPHVKNDFISMSGIRSEGVEVFFPLSPKHFLIMYDG